MSPSDGLESRGDPARSDGGASGVETMLFESLVYHLIEKGVLTKNDALSIVQTVAEVKQSKKLALGDEANVERDLRLLRQLFESFQAVRGRTAQC